MTTNKTKKHPPCRGRMTARGPLTDIVALAASFGGAVHSAVHAPGKSRRAKGVTTLDVTFPIEALNNVAYACCSDSPHKMTFVSERDQRAAAG